MKRSVLAFIGGVLLLGAALAQSSRPAGQQAGRKTPQLRMVLPEEAGWYSDTVGHLPWRLCRDVRVEGMDLLVEYEVSAEDIEIDGKDVKASRVTVEVSPRASSAPWRVYSSVVIYLDRRVGKYVRFAGFGEPGLLVNIDEDNFVFLSIEGLLDDSEPRVTACRNSRPPEKEGRPVATLPKMVHQPASESL